MVVSVLMIPGIKPLEATTHLIILQLTSLNTINMSNTLSICHFKNERFVPLCLLECFAALSNTGIMSGNTHNDKGLITEY
jgi:hypothetical protein